MPSPSPKKVNIMVSSNLKGIACTHVPFEDVNTNITWLTFFNRRGITVNQERHWVKSGSNKHVGCMNETIESFLNQYEKRKPPTLHVHIVRTNKKTKEVFDARRNKIKRERLIEEAARAEAVPGPSRVGRIHKKNVSVPNGQIPIIRARPSVNLGASARPSVNFPEDNFPNLDPVEEQNENDIGDDGVMFDDDASQCSQDSQDPGDDMKGEVIEKLRMGACNGDFHRVKEELLKLKRQNRKMKVARYIPYAMNLLSLMFDD